MMAQQRLYAMAPTPRLESGWTNFDGTSTIYITSNTGLNIVELTLVNQLGDTVMLPTGTPSAFGSLPAGQSAIYIFFEGMLSNAEVEAIQVTPQSSAQWTVANFLDKSGLAYLVLAPVSQVQVDNGRGLEFKLTNILATTANFSGSVVINIVGATGIDPMLADMQVFVNVQNQPATENQELDLLVGFAGSDLVFTGGQKNELTLYLTNPNPSALVPGGSDSWGPYPPTFQLSLVFGDGPGALTSAGDASDIAVNIADEFGNVWQAVEPQQQGRLPTWIMQPNAKGGGTVLGTGESATISFAITNILTQLRQGLTFAYLSYRNIPGYNDGFYGIEILKVNPIVINSFTATPSSLANVITPTAVTLAFEVQNASYVTITNSAYASAATENTFSGNTTVTTFANTTYTLIVDNFVTGQTLSLPLEVTVGTPDLLATSFATATAAVSGTLLAGSVVVSGSTQTAQIEIGNATNNGHQNNYSRLDFLSGGEANGLAAISIEEYYGLNLYGSSNQPVKIQNANFEVCAGNATISGQLAANSVAINSAQDGFENAALNVSGGWTRIGAYNTQSLPQADGLGGTAIGWNRSGGFAETNLYNVYSGAPTSFQFSQLANGNYIDLVTFSGNGHVGIGTTAPLAPLHIKLRSQVSGSGTIVDQYLILSTYQWHSGDGNGWAFPTLTDRGQTQYPNTSILANGAIVGPIYYCFSDQRIKVIEGVSNGANDLKTLLGLEITDYHYKDILSKDGGPHKKLVAQQVEQIFPQAVSTLTEVVPDIFHQATVSADWLILATDLKEGERVRLISADADDVYEVLEATSEKFRTQLKVSEKQVFVYGREVSDFRTLDYDAIAMLNVSATQQIKKETDMALSALQAENETLRHMLALSLKELRAEIEACKKH